MWRTNTWRRLIFQSTCNSHLLTRKNLILYPTCNTPLEPSNNLLLTPMVQQNYYWSAKCKYAEFDPSSNEYKRRWATTTSESDINEGFKPRKHESSCYDNAMLSPKKDESRCMCMDYAIEKVITKFSHPRPRLKDLLNPGWISSPTS